MDPNSQPRLAALGDEQEYRISSGEVDPRGWRIVDCDGVLLGSVRDLVIDLDALTARYIVCSLSRGSREVLVPTGFARIENEQEAVHLDFISAATADKLPTYDGLPVGAELLARTAEVLTGVTPTAAPRSRIVRRRD